MDLLIKIEFDIGQFLCAARNLSSWCSSRNFHTHRQKKNAGATKTSTLKNHPRYFDDPSDMGTLGLKFKIHLFPHSQLCIIDFLCYCLQKSPTTNQLSKLHEAWAGSEYPYKTKYDTL